MCVTKIEQRVNLEKYSANQKPVSLNGNKIMRICLLAGLSNKEQETLLQLSKSKYRKQATGYLKHFLHCTTWVQHILHLLKLTL
jgi:hypothetical protein